MCTQQLEARITARLLQANTDKGQGGWSEGLIFDVYNLFISFIMCGDS